MVRQHKVMATIAFAMQCGIQKHGAQPLAAVICRQTFWGSASKGQGPSMLTKDSDEGVEGRNQDVEPAPNALGLAAGQVQPDGKHKIHRREADSPHQCDKILQVMQRY